MAKRQEAERVYVVRYPDEIPPDELLELRTLYVPNKWCRMWEPPDAGRPGIAGGYICTRTKGHSGMHVAHLADGCVVATWDLLPKDLRWDVGL
jgi:hypothetical protein